MLTFYFNASPNPAKVALFLEESGLPYEAIPIDTRTGEQFSAAFVALNPNSKGFDTISARPAAIRASALKDRFTFKADMDEEARRIMFPHIVKP
jgi:hypothetical protein